MLANDLALLVALEPFGSRAPGLDHTLGVQADYGVLLEAFDQHPVVGIGAWSRRGQWSGND